MDNETASIIAMKAITFIIGNGHLCDRFLALTGLEGADIRNQLQHIDFQTNALEFLISHDPDLIACSEDIDVPPQQIVYAWRCLGGGKGQEW